MKVWIVVKTDLKMQNIVGIYSTEEKAYKAKEQIEDCFDNYDQYELIYTVHEYEVE